MKKAFKSLTGGIGRKILWVFILALLIVVVTFTTVIIDQLGDITDIISESNNNQQNLIREKATDTTENLIEESLGYSTRIEATLIDNVFQAMRRTVSHFASNMMIQSSEVTSGFLSSQIDTVDSIYKLYPQIDDDGKTTTQLLNADLLDMTDPDQVDSKKPCNRNCREKQL